MWGLLLNLKQFQRPLYANSCTSGFHYLTKYRMITTHHISEPLYSHFIHPSNSNSNRGMIRVLAGGARLAARYVASKRVWNNNPPLQPLHLPLGLWSISWEPLVEIVYSQGIGCFWEESWIYVFWENVTVELYLSYPIFFMKHDTKQFIGIEEKMTPIMTSALKVFIDLTHIC